MVLPYVTAFVPETVGTVILSWDTIYKLYTSPYSLDTSSFY